MLSSYRGPFARSQASDTWLLRHCDEMGWCGSARLLAVNRNIRGTLVETHHTPDDRTQGISSKRRCRNVGPAAGTTSTILPDQAISGVTSRSVLGWPGLLPPTGRSENRSATPKTKRKREWCWFVPRRPENPTELQIQVTNHSSRVIMDLTFIRLVVDGHDHLDDLQPTLGPFPVIAAPAATSHMAGPLAGSSLFTFNPDSDSYGPTHPYFIAVKGGPNNEPRTITGATLLTATIQWTDASGKTWQRSGTSPADASSSQLGTPVRIR